MRKVILTTFPRSGHHLLVGYLRRFYGAEMVYRDPYQPGQPTEEEATVTKSHDFDLADDPAVGVRIVLIRRNKLLALQSWFDFDVKHSQIEDSQESWELFCASKGQFYDRWLSKWYGATKVFNYESLVQTPRIIVMQICDRIQQGDVDLWRVNDAVNSPILDASRDGHFISRGLLRKADSFRYPLK
jgi:hypothetical protein